MDYRDDILLCCQGSGFQSVEYMSGILKAFEEIGVKPGHAMTSSGSSLTMALYYSKGLDFIYQMMNDHEPSDFITIKPVDAVREVLNMTNAFIDNTNIKTLLEENMTSEATKRQLTGVTRLRDFKNFMVPATPATVLAASAIEACFVPVKIEEELFGDSGLLNNTPTPTFQEAENWKHIFVCVSPEPQFNNTNETPFITYLLNLFSAIAYREIHQIQESGFLDLENVTFIQPYHELSSGLLKWSDNFEFRTLCYKQTKDILKNVEL